MKRIGEIETERYTLTIYECECGFHIGLDNTYMDQVEGILIVCPACGEDIDTDFIDDIEQEDIDESIGC